MTVWILFRNQYYLTTTQTADGWEIHQPDADAWVSTSVPNTIMTAKNIFELYEGHYAAKLSYPVFASCDRTVVMDHYQSHKHNFPEGYSLYSLPLAEATPRKAPKLEEVNLDDIPF